LEFSPIASSASTITSCLISTTKSLWLNSFSSASPVIGMIRREFEILLLIPSYELLHQPAGRPGALSGRADSSQPQVMPCVGVHPSTQSMQRLNSAPSKFVRILATLSLPCSDRVSSTCDPIEHSDLDLRWSI